MRVVFMRSCLSTIGQVSRYARQVVYRKKSDVNVVPLCHFPQKTSKYIYNYSLFFMFE